jgi:hypothetical protein
LLTHAEVKKRQTNRGTKQSISRLKKHVSQGKLQPPLKSQAKSKQQQEATPRFISSRSSIQEAKPSTRKNKNKRQKIQDQREGIHKA